MNFLQFPTRARRLLSAAGLVAVGSLLALPASSSATLCPSLPYSPGEYYCIPTADYENLILGDNPSGYFRMGDDEGAPVMENTAPGQPDGEFKNKQDSGPVGISGDGDTAREFYGENGYGYVNGIEAPRDGLSNWTVEVWIYLTNTDNDLDTVDDGAIFEFGEGPGLYIESQMLTLRNGNVSATDVTTDLDDEKWYMLVARKSGSQLRLYVNESPTSPTEFDAAPKASLTSTYVPGGSPTMYVGYGNRTGKAFHGSIDEVAYFPDDLLLVDIAEHFYADPPPAKATMKRGPAATPAAGTPLAAATALKAAKANVKRLQRILKKSQAKLKALKRHGASAKAIKKAKRKVATVKKMLRKARRRVSQLAP